MPVPPEQRFWPKVAKGSRPDDCWIWTAGRYRTGYGLFSTPEKKHVMAHRFAYELLVGPIADGMHLDHTCHTDGLSCPGGDSCPHRPCVNPAHLRPVSPKENKLIGRGPSAKHAAQTHCKNGHPLTPDNLVPSKLPRRKCRICHAEDCRRYEIRRKAKRAGIPVEDATTRRYGGDTCQRGHSLTGENLYVKPNGTRVCRTCQRDYLRAWRERQA